MPLFTPARKTPNVPCCSLNETYSSLELFVKQILPHSQRRSNASHTLPFSAISQPSAKGARGGGGQCGAQIAFSVPVHFGTILLGRRLCSARLELVCNPRIRPLALFESLCKARFKFPNSASRPAPNLQSNNTCRLAQLGAPTSSITASSAMTDAL